MIFMLQRIHPAFPNHFHAVTWSLLFFPAVIKSIYIFAKLYYRLI